MRKITFTTPTGGPIVLGDDANKLFVSGYLRNGRPRTQVAAPMRAAGITVFNRRNFQSDVTWRTSRVFGGIGLLDEFVHTHPEALEGVGSLVVEVGSGTFGAAQFTLGECVVTCVFERIVGVHLFVRYEAVGGRFV